MHQNDASCKSNIKYLKCLKYFYNSKISSLIGKIKQIVNVK